MTEYVPGRRALSDEGVDELLKGYGGWESHRECLPSVECQNLLGSLFFSHR